MEVSSGCDFWNAENNAFDAAPIGDRCFLLSIHYIFLKLFQEHSEDCVWPATFAKSLNQLAKIASQSKSN